MNYNKRYNDEFDWEESQSSYASFPEDWNFGEDSRAYGKDDHNGNKGGRGSNDNRKCYFGQFMICEKGQKEDNKRPDRCKCHEEKENNDWKDGCEKRHDNCGNHQNRNCCRCPICNFCRRFRF